MINKSIREITRLISTSNGRYDTVKTPTSSYTQTEIIMLIKAVKEQCKNVHKCYVTPINIVFVLDDYVGNAFFTQGTQDLYWLSKKET